MSTFAERIRTLLGLAPPRAIPAEPAKGPSRPPRVIAPPLASSAGCAGSAPPPSRDTPAEWAGWSEAARYVFEERMAMAEHQGMTTSPGRLAWRIALEEATAEDSPRLIATALKVFSSLGTVRMISTEPRFRNQPGGERTDALRMM